MLPILLSGFHTEGGRGALVPPLLIQVPPRNKMKRCNLLPGPLKYLDIPDCPPCMQILYETLNIESMKVHSSKMNVSVRLAVHNELTFTTLRVDFRAVASGLEFFCLRKFGWKSGRLKPDRLRR